MRWLLAIMAALLLWSSAVTSWAAAGFVGESECCCPVKAECRCHDHDGDRQPDATLKKCGGEAELIAPVALAAVVPLPAALPAPLLRLATVHHRLLPLQGALPSPPETPPF